MSKVEFKSKDYEPAMKVKIKQKLRKTLRRLETKKKKEDRAKISKIGRFTTKYYMVDEKPVYEKRERLISPERTVTVYKNVTVYYPPRDWLGETKGHMVIEPKAIGFKTIPKKIRSYSCITYYRPIKPYVKRWSNSGPWKKKCKKKSSRAMRQNKDYDLPISRGGYKKVYDLLWDLW